MPHLCSCEYTQNYAFGVGLLDALLYGEVIYSQQKCKFLTLSVLGEKPVLVAFTRGLDNRVAQEFGVPFFNCWSLCGNLHGFDEYVTIDSVFETTQIMALMILDLCGYKRIKKNTGYLQNHKI